MCISIYLDDLTQLMVGRHSIENKIETSTQYFKAKPNKFYLVSVDLDKHKIMPVEQTDSNGNPQKRYEMIIQHVNNGKEQTWTVGKTVCLQIITELRNGFKVLKVERIGEDRGTIYRIQVVE
jgi:hypothetical protein